MTCTGLAYAAGWEYAAFWSVSSILLGADNSGGVGNLFLTNTQADFQNSGLEANVGMVLYNLTQGTSGPITNVTATTVTATGVTWDNGDVYRAVAVDGSQIATIENYLRVVAANIDIARASVGACDCTLSASAAALLSKLNIIETGCYHQAVCGMPAQHLTTEQKGQYLMEVNRQLDFIYSGQIELCAGETGSTFPVVGWAEQAHTEFGQAQIIANRIRRYGI